MKNNDSLLECLQKKHGENNSAIADDARMAFDNYNKRNRRSTTPFEFMICPYGYQSFLMPIDTIVVVGSRLGIVTDYRLLSDGWNMCVRCSDGSYDVRYEDAAIAPLPDGLVKIIEKRCMDEIIRRTEK